ncbi:MAG: CRISPR-associated endonuclease Cas2 [Bacillota bacterium]|jgi:CRISPR-associated protein Cas2
MQTLVIYDIESDRVRYKVAEACKDYGLERIQYSAFWGEISNNRREELIYRLRHTLGRKVGNIIIFAICDRDLKLKKELRNQGDYSTPN